MKNLILLVLFSFVSGCYTNGVLEDSHTSDRSANALVKELYARGANPSSTSKLVFKGSEADVGPDIQVVVTDRHVIDAVWDSISNSTDDGRFSACGWRTIEFHSAHDSNTPLASLRVYCGGIDHGDAAYVEGTRPFQWDNAKGGRFGLYACKGLHEIVMKHLKEEYERRQEK